MTSWRRKARRHRTEEITDIQLTSLMDILCTLMFFLLASLVLIKVGMIDVPVPKVVSTSEAPPSNKVPFKMTVEILPHGLIVESNAVKGGKVVIENLPEGEIDKVAFHRLMIDVKQRFPNEKSITILPADVIPYQKIVDVMDASRELVDADPIINGVVRPKINDIGKDGTVFDPAMFELFPDVVMGGVT